MRHVWCPLLVIWVLCAGEAFGQVTVTANGSNSEGTMVSGDTLSWIITCPSGATVSNKLVVDADSNGRFEPGTDRSIFEFTQTDGQTGTDGPGDDDGTVNGVITTTFVAGLAPAHWMLITILDAASDTVSLRVWPLASPAAFINGTVHGPGETDISNILIEASPQGSQGMYFWHGLTEANGQYSIQMGDNPTSYNPWQVRIGMPSSALGGLVEYPKRDTSVDAGPTPAVVDFNLIYGTVLTGTVKDTSNIPVVDASPHTHDPLNSNSDGEWYAQTNADGVYYLTVPPGSYLLHFTKPGYKDEWYNGQTNSSNATTIVVTNEDTIPNLNGTLIKAGLIRGSVTVDGSGVNATVALYTTDGNEQQSTNTHEGGSYDFTVDPGSYFVRFEYNAEVRWYNNFANYPPPDTLTITGTEAFENIDIDFGVGPTGVEVNPAPPGSFELGQNYPNPFNPSTEITFQLPLASYVSLKVFDILGRVVAVLVNKELPPGTNSTTWEANRIPSGMYFYRLESTAVDGTRFVQTRKMVLLR